MKPSVKYKTIFLTLVISTTLSLLFSINSQAQTSSGSFLDPAILATRDVYKFIDGDLKEFILYTNKGSKEVTPDLNVLNANGRIGRPEELFTDPVTMETSGCAGEHFHGIIGTTNDPNPHGCGWGRVVQLTTEADLIVELLSSKLVTDFLPNEQMIGGNIGQLSLGFETTIENFINISADLEVQINKLAGFITDLKKQIRDKNITPKNGNLIISKLTCAKTNDERTKKLLDKLQKVFTSDDGSRKQSELFSSIKKVLDAKMANAIKCKEELQESIKKLQDAKP